MFKNIFYILSILLLLASCKAGKKVASQTSSKSTTVKGSKEEGHQDLVLFLEAEKARLTGEYPMALALYAKYIDLNNQNPTAFYNIARIYFHNKDVPAAIKNAKKAAQLDPTNKYFQEFYIQLLVYNNDTRQAESQFNILIRKNPENDDYIYKKAMLYVKAKEYEKAINTFSDLEKKVGFNEDIILQKKALYQRLGKTDLAIGELKKLRDAEPSAVQYTIMMIDAYETGGQTEKAKEVYNELELRYPNELR